MESIGFDLNFSLCVLKAPPKKTVEELAKLDQEDESLRKWKESLGVSSGAGEIDSSKDPRKLIILSMHMEVAGRDDVLLDLSSLGMKKILFFFRLSLFFFFFFFFCISQIEYTNRHTLIFVEKWI
ncbi:hypothetical protein HMI55_003965 [Coelomomyces lativittatus]|nr:hypothetical protein HMI55_003965 [Coelomomyces lativittatus]